MGNLDKAPTQASYTSAESPHPPNKKSATPLTRETARRVVYQYGEAWEKQDISRIVTLFTKKAIYHEQLFKRPIRGRKNIAKYWHTRVVRGQSNIRFKLLHIFVDGHTAIAEWEAQFDVVARRERLIMRQVAILEFEGHLISSLREYWTSKKLPKLSNHTRAPTGPGKCRTTKRRQ